MKNQSPNNDTKDLFSYVNKSLSYIYIYITLPDEKRIECSWLILQILPVSQSQENH